MGDRPRRVAVIGGADERSGHQDLARQTGTEIARAGAVLLCGGRGGVIGLWLAGQQQQFPPQAQQLGLVLERPAWLGLAQHRVHHSQALFCLTHKQIGPGQQGSQDGLAQKSARLAESLQAGA